LATLPVTIDEIAIFYTLFPHLCPAATSAATPSILGSCQFFDFANQARSCSSAGRHRVPITNIGGEAQPLSLDNDCGFKADIPVAWSALAYEYSGDRSRRVGISEISVPPSQTSNYYDAHFFPSLKGCGR
jgi:hypothetical protein